MATVWLARAVDGRQGPPLVAIKRPHQHLSADATFLKMIVDEARLASSIRHPNVVKVHELGFEGGMPFIVMDYVEGASLAELRRELNALGRTVDPRVGLRIALDALEGLHAAHVLKDESGRPLNIVHRDVSPHNVLIGHDGRSLITDFGIAHAENRVQTTRTHEIKGKLAYMAPERVDKRRICTAQSDVFSMAVVLWECLAGRRLFRADDAVEVLQEVLTLPIPSLRQVGARVSEPLDDVVSRALSRDLDSRYATASDLARAIEKAAGTEIGSHADVSRLVEAVFGPRMSERQGCMRGAVGSETLAALLQESGLPPRDPTAERPGHANLAELAPPAAPASARYELRRPRGPLPRLRLRRAHWAIAAAGVALGSIATLGLRPIGAHPAPIVVAPPIAALSATAPTPSTRRIVVPLPFPASRVTLDDVPNDLDPPADVATFEVPVSSGPRHEVVAVALDGTRAEGPVQEVDGIARPETEGFSYLEAPHAPPPDNPRASNASNHGVRPPGTTRNGFTKLR
jgi:serine/threonine-protein kinase